MDLKSAFNSGSFFSCAIFAAVLIGVFIVHMIFSFERLTSRTGIDQAQVAHEVARGNNLTTKFVRPIRIQKLIENEKTVDLTHTLETFHIPQHIFSNA